MKRNVLVLLSAAALAGTASLAQAEAKIGVINTQRLMNEAPQAKTAMDVLRAEFAPREKEVNTLQAQLKAREEKLQKDAATMSEMQRSAEEKALTAGYRDLKAKQEAAEEDYTARANEERAKLNATLVEEVRSYAKAQSYDVIFADGVLYATPAYDVTGPVLEALKRKSGAPAAAPAAAAPAPARPAAPAPAKP